MPTRQCSPPIPVINEHCAWVIRSLKSRLEETFNHGCGTLLAQNYRMVGTSGGVACTYISAYGFLNGLLGSKQPESPAGKLRAAENCPFWHITLWNQGFELLKWEADI